VAAAVRQQEQEAVSVVMTVKVNQLKKMAVMDQNHALIGWIGKSGKLVMLTVVLVKEPDPEYAPMGNVWEQLELTVQVQEQKQKIVQIYHPVQFGLIGYRGPPVQRAAQVNKHVQGSVKMDQDVLETEKKHNNVLTFHSVHLGMIGAVGVLVH